MPTAETLRALLALVEEAKAGSRELDGHLTAAFDPPMDYAGEPADIFICMDPDDRGVFKSYVATPAAYPQSVPPLTTSIDAALALVAKVLPGWIVERMSDRARGHIGALKLIGAYVELENGEKSAIGKADTRPLAILAALLRALLQQSETAHVER